MRVPIRERRPRRDEEIIPVESQPAQPASAPQLPLCLTFRYRGRLILCTPAWNDAGVPIAITFACPHCFTRLDVGSPDAQVEVNKAGAVTVHRHVRCAPNGCGLRLHISSGLALECYGQD